MRPFDRRLAPWLLTLALPACGTETEEPSSARGADAPTSSAPALGPSPAVQPPAAPFAQDTFVLRLGEVPPSLASQEPTSPGWIVWLQELVGPDVRVEGARVLRAPGVKSPRPTAGGSLLVRVTADGPERLRAAVARANTSGRVDRAELDPIWTAHSAPNDPDYSEQWYLPKIGAEDAWGVTSGSSSVVVAVLDSGVDIDHEDLVTAIWENAADPVNGVDDDGNGYVDDRNGWNFVDDTNDVNDPVGHGTHVAGIIGARANNGVGIAGIASGVRVMPVVIGSSGIQASTVAEAITYAVDQGAHVINMSFGGPLPLALVRSAIQYAAENGVLLVASTGNNASLDFNYPATYEQVIAVGSLDSSDRRATTSQFGHWVDISAPGVSIYSTRPNDTYAVDSGTSFAAPLVAGALALVQSAHPTWTPEQTKRQVLAAAKNVTPDNPDYLGLLGAGLLDAAAAVGAEITTPRAYLTSVHLKEDGGDGNQTVDPGEDAVLSVGLRFTSAGAVTARLSTADPWVTITQATSALTPTELATSVARFEFELDPGAPLDHEVSFTLELENSSNVVVDEEELQVRVAPSVRRFQLPFSHDRAFAALGGDEHVFVADDSYRGEVLRDIVYGTVRKADGSFAPITVLSDTSRSARRPQAVVDAAGNAHVVFYQYVASNDFAAFPAYARYDATTEAWDTTQLLSSGSQLQIRGENNLAIGIDSSGTLHLAWAWITGVVVTHHTGSGWAPQTVIAIPDQDQIDVRFVTVGGDLKLLAHPVLAPVVGATDYTLPFYLMEYSGSSWSSPVELTQIASGELSLFPFEFDGVLSRLYQPASSTEARLSQLVSTDWVDEGLFADLGAGDFRRGLFAAPESTTALRAFFTPPVSLTNGTERVVRLGGLDTTLPGDRKYRARVPWIGLDDDSFFHAFNQEHDVQRFFGEYYERAAHTSYFTDAPLPAGARPTIPVVTDGGATTDDDRYLTASWSSIHADGIRSYAVAWGSAPGAADIIPWHEKSVTSDSFDLDTLGHQRLIPGQTVYLSVRANGSALLPSEIGFSDGITYEPGNRCTEPLWDTNIVYQDAGLEVTYLGKKYSNLYWNSGVTPASGGPWVYVEDCTGAPLLQACTASAWSPSSFYSSGARVSHGGHEFVASWSQSGITPTGTAGNAWKWVDSCL